MRLIRESTMVFNSILHIDRDIEQTTSINQSINRCDGPNHVPLNHQHDIQTIQEYRGASWWCVTSSHIHAPIRLSIELEASLVRLILSHSGETKRYIFLSLEISLLLL